MYESDYVPATFTPGSSVETNHELLAGMRENDFDTSDSAYTYGLLTLAMVFLVAGILACILLPCCYLAIGKSRQEMLSERLNFGRKMHYKGNLVMLVASVAAIATACGAIWGLEKTDTGLTNIEQRTQTIASDLQKILNLPNDTLTVLNQITEDLDTLTSDATSCVGSVLPSSVADFDTGLTELTDSVLEEFDLLKSESLSNLADDVQGVSDAVNDTEGVRKGVVWPAVALAMAFTAIFIVIAVGTYGFIACGTHTCGPVGCIVSPCTVFLAIIIWLSAASAVTLSALSGDFCTDPDTNVETLIAKSSDDETLRSLLTYYTGDCTSDNFAIDAVIAAQEAAIPVLQEALPLLFSVSASSICSGIGPSIDALNMSLFELWSLLEEAGQLSSCENLNEPYQAAVYTELCYELPKGLLGFWVSCVILTVLLLVLAVQWNRLLRRQLTEEEAQLAEARARNRPAWVPKMLSRRSFNSNASSSSRRGMTDTRRSTRPAANPVPDRWGMGVAVGAPASGSHANNSVQRPVEIANPMRQAR